MKRASRSLLHTTLAIVLAAPLMAASCDAQDTKCMASGFNPNEQVVIQESPSSSTSGVADADGNVAAPCGSTVTNLHGGTTSTSTETPVTSTP